MIYKDQVTLGLSLEGAWQRSGATKPSRLPRERRVWNAERRHLRFSTARLLRLRGQLHTDLEPFYITNYYIMLSYVNICYYTART